MRLNIDWASWPCECLVQLKNELELISVRSSNDLRFEIEDAIAARRLEWAEDLLTSIEEFARLHELCPACLSPEYAEGRLCPACLSGLRAADEAVRREEAKVR